jgi:hypothetical protein
MKHLVILSFAIGLLGAPIAAQAQQSIPGSPEGFNGLVWDPPGYAAVEGYTAPDVSGHAATVQRNHSPSGM